MKRLQMTNDRRRAIAGFCFTAPWILGFIYFFLIPFIKAFFYSMSSIKIGRSGFDLNWVGFKNYNRVLFEDPQNMRMIITAIGDMIVSVVVVVLLSLFIAIILNQKFFGRGLARVVFALPIIISSGVIIVLLKQNVLQQDMNVASAEAMTIFQASNALKFLTEAGISQQVITFFEGLASNIFDMIWSSGMQIILFLSALQSIPKSSYEAANIEGATAWESFWFVTFPMLGPFLLVNIIYTIIDKFTDSTSQVMNKIVSLVNGVKYEDATALSMSYCLLVLIIVLIVYVIASRRIYYAEK